MRALDSGIDEVLNKDFTSPDELGIKIRKSNKEKSSTDSVSHSEPETDLQIKPKAPADYSSRQNRLSQPANSQPAESFKPPVAGNTAGRDSLLPKQMLYKAAPMQTPLNQDGQSPYVMPKDYALYGQDAMRINTPPEEPEQKKEEPKQNKKAKKHIAAVAVSAILLAVVVFVSAFTAIMKYYCDSGSLFGGRSVCVVEESTKSPYLNRGDIVFVKPAKPEKLEEETVVAFYDKEQKFIKYGIITDIKEDDGGKKTVTVKGVSNTSKITQQEVRAELILGTADDYLPKAGYLVNLLNRYTVICACAAGIAVLLLIIILIVSLKSGKKAAADDKSSSI